MALTLEIIVPVNNLNIAKQIDSPNASIAEEIAIGATPLLLLLPSFVIFNQMVKSELTCGAEQ